MYLHRVSIILTKEQGGGGGYLSDEVGHVGAHDHKRDLIDCAAESEAVLAALLLPRRHLEPLQQECARQRHKYACTGTFMLIRSKRVIWHIQGPQVCLRLKISY